MNDQEYAEYAEFYDSHWADAADGCKTDELRADVVCKLIDRFLADSGGVRKVTVLDVGSGWGWLTDRISRYGKATGTEPSRKGVAEARARFPHVTFLNDSFPSVALSGQSFDVVVCSEVIEHVNDQQCFVAGLAEVTEAGGGVVLTTPNGKWWSRIKQLADGRLQPVENWLTWHELENLLKRNGFTIRRHLEWYTGWTSRGVFRFQNSCKLRKVLEAVHCGALLGATSRLLKLGLYQGILAIKEA